MTERDDGTRQEVAGLSDEQKALHAKILAGKLRGSSPPIRAGLSVGPERLSASQLDFWIADKLCPDTALNNLSCIVQIHKRLDVALFRRSVDALVERHDALRTSIEETSGEPRQVVRPVSRIDLPCTDLRHLPQSARVDVALGAAREILMRPIPFDGELFRVALWQLEDDVFELLLVMHHAISDGWSIGLFLSDLMETYAAEESGQAQSKGASPTRYVDYVRWLEDDTGREARTRSALEFWRTAVADTVKPATLAFDHDARTGLLGPGERLSVTIAPELRDAIKRAQRECQVSPSTIILAAVGAVLARLSGVARPVVGLYMSSRRHPATHGTIGAFVHTIPVPVDLTADPDVRTTLKAIHSFLGRAIASEPINVGRLASALGVPRSDGQSPFFRVAVSMQHTLDGVEAHGLRFRRVPYESSGTALYDVLVNVFDRADGLILALDYRKDRYESETIDQFARALELVLSGAAASLDARMTTLPIPTADRRAPLESDAASRGLAWWTERLSGDESARSPLRPRCDGPIARW
jgi:hypothetical protein